MSHLRDVDFCNSLQLDHQHQFLQNLKSPSKYRMASATLNAAPSDKYFLPKNLRGAVQACFTAVFMQFWTVSLTFTGVWHLGLSP